MLNALRRLAQIATISPLVSFAIIAAAVFALALPLIGLFTVAIEQCGAAQEAVL
jgi:hypothetical protein